MVSNMNIRRVNTLVQNIDVWLFKITVFRTVNVMECSSSKTKELEQGDGNYKLVNSN